MALPSNLSTVTVTAKYLDTLGNPIAGQVKFTPRVTLSNSAQDTILINSTVTVTLDNTGSFSAVLVATDDPDALPTEFTYRVEEAFIGGRTFDITLPSTPSTIDLADKLPATPAFGVGSLFVTVDQFNALEARVTVTEGDITALQLQANTFYNALTATLNTAIATSSTNIDIVNNLVRDLAPLEDNGQSVTSLLLLKSA
jgi:hypothetical protein